MNTNVKWMLVAGVACAGGAGAWLLSGGSETSSDMAATTTAQRAQQHVAAPEDRAPGCNFAPGVTLAYDVATEDRAELDLNGLGPNVSNSEVEVSTRARLELQALSSDGDGAVLLGRFATVQSDSVVDDAKLKSPFLIRVGEDCALDGFAHLKGVDAGYARVQQAMLHELSWSWPEGSRGEFEGRNANGSFVASVTRSKSGEFVQSLKSFEPWSKGHGAVDRVSDSLQQVAPGGVAWFQSLKGHADYAGPRTRVMHTVRANYVGADVSSLADAPTDDSAYVWADLLPTQIPLAETPAPTESELHALAEARKLTVDQAVDNYVALATNPEVGIQDTWPPLRTYLEARPEASQEVIEKLKRREMPAEATMGAYIALGNARTPQAKAALEGVMRDTNAPVIERSRAILSLIDRPDTGVELATYLGEKSSKLATGETAGDRVLARQSLLALGAMSGRKPNDEDIKQAALQEISRRLEETRHKGEAWQRPVFGALANIGDPATLELVADIPQHSDPDVREAAAIVFRRMPPAESADFAARWLAVETDANVKRKLWHTIELQTFDARENMPREVLKHAVRDLRQKPGPITRKALVRMLARAKTELGEDDLGIEDTFVALIPWEFDQKSGFERFMHDAIDPERRDALYLEIARKYDGEDASATDQTPPIRIPSTPTAAAEKAQ